jgi:hypothetical protein
MKRNTVQQQARLRKGARPPQQAARQDAKRPRDHAKDTARRSCYHPPRKGCKHNGQTPDKKRFPEIDTRIPQIDTGKIQSADAANRSHCLFADP